MRSPILALSLTLFAGAALAAPAGGLSSTGPDPHSYANFDQVRVTHVHLDLDVEFGSERLSGSVELELEWLDPDADRVVLDTRGLDVLSVHVAEGLVLDHALEGDDPVLGSALVVQASTQPERIVVDYRTRPDATALQWLSAEQTAGGRQPFLFSQGQAHHTRTWIPLMDTPAVRVTYTAELVVPEGMLALMSAENPTERSDDGRYSFRMPQPIPSYLIAIAAGDLVFRSIGEDTGIYAEPELIDASVWEFADTQRMLDIAEEQLGEYDWGRYDLLILPPSFPFGGMEHARLSFITPTVLNGDRSMVSLIAHELAHSWSGNRVTNAGWRELWLNEGFTSYLDNRLIEAIYGEDRARMEASLSYRDLRETLETLPEAEQALAVDYSGRDPDEVFTDIPYNKGMLFLMTMERAYGREVFDAFLKDYFDHFAFRSLTTEEFLEYWEANLGTTHPQAMSRADLEAWIYQPGLPAQHHVPRSDAFAGVDAAREAWLSGELHARALPLDDWTIHEQLHFLGGMPEGLGTAAMAELDLVHGLTWSRNHEVAFAWLRLAIGNRYQPAYPRLREFMVSIGRNKFVGPLYEDLVASGWGRGMAERIYREARPGYHPLTRNRAESALAAD